KARGLDRPLLRPTRFSLLSAFVADYNSSRDLRGGASMPVLDSFRLDGRRALVTGASRGLGRAIAQALAEAGADLVLAGRTPETLEAAWSALEATGRRVEAVRADLHSAEGARALCEQVLAAHAPIDVLVNNVGGRREDLPTAALDVEKWRGYLELNLT